MGKVVAIFLVCGIFSSLSFGSITLAQKVTSVEYLFQFPRTIKKSTVQATSPVESSLLASRVFRANPDQASAVRSYSENSTETFFSRANLIILTLCLSLLLSAFLIYFLHAEKRLNIIQKKFFSS